MKDNQIHFNVKGGQVKVSYKHTPALDEFLTIVFTGCIAAMNQIVASEPPENQEQCKKDLYDMFNVGASNTLHYFAPEIDARPHLTTQAILEAENAIIEREYRKKKEDPNYESPFAEN